PDEILMEVEVAYHPPHTAGAYGDETVRANDFPIASVAVVIGLDENGEKIEGGRIVIAAVGPTPIRATEAEQIILGKKVEDRLPEEAGVAAASEVCPISDLQGSVEYKREIVRVLTKRMIDLAIKRARG
ncbi:unnamed protein product, partial [marine sediment metagenome]